MNGWQPHTMECPQCVSITSEHKAVLWNGLQYHFYVTRINRILQATRNQSTYLVLTKTAGKELQGKEEVQRQELKAEHV